MLSYYVAAAVGGSDRLIGDGSWNHFSVCVQAKCLVPFQIS